MVNQFFLSIGIFVPFLPLLLLDVFDPDPETFEDPCLALFEFVELF